MRKNPRYKFVWKPGHPLAHKRGLVREHRLVLYDKIGDGVHQCYWCKKDVIWQTLANVSSVSLIADHLDGNPTNNSPENLVPSCNNCNSKRTVGIQAGEVFFLDSQGRRNRGVYRACKHCQKEFIAPIAESQKMRNQSYCSKTCFFADIKNPELQRTCLVCDKEFIAKASNVKRGRGKYCSRGCFYAGRKLSKEVQENLTVKR